MAQEEPSPITFEEMAEAMLARNDLLLRGLVMEWQRTHPPFNTIPRPQTDDPRILTAAAALVELLASRAGEEPPVWTAAIGALPEPFFVMTFAERPGFTRTLCLTEAPEPLKRRNIFSPPNFLHMV